MTEPKFFVPSIFLSFVEHKQEEFLTQEEQLFAKKVFQYMLRALNGLSCASKRLSLNQKALIRTALAWAKEYEDFKKGCPKPRILSPVSQEKRKSVVKADKIESTKAETYSAAMADVLHGQIYTADNQYVMVRVHVPSFNEKRRGEHRYPRQRN